MKIAIVGAGSLIWTMGFVRQFVNSSCLQKINLVLLDIDTEALSLIERAANIYNDKQGSPINIQATTDVDSALDAAGFVIVSISTG